MQIFLLKFTIKNELALLHLHMSPMTSVHHCSVCVLFIKYIHGLLHLYFLIETNTVYTQSVTE